MIQHPSSDNPFSRGFYGGITIAGITAIYIATLFRKDAWLILGITFALYGVFRLARRLLAGISADKLDRILFYSFILLSLIPLGYGIWTYLIQS